jgi:hypothetical protein
MSEVERLERVIKMLVDFLRDVWPEEDRSTIDAVVSGLDIGKEEEND